MSELLNNTIAKRTPRGTIIANEAVNPDEALVLGQTTITKVVEDLPLEPEQDVIYLVNSVGEEASSTGKWIHKATKVETQFDMTADFISGTTMNRPSWIDDASEIYIPNGVEIISSNALNNNPDLNLVSLPKTVTDIHAGALNNNPKLNKLWVYPVVPPSFGASTFGDYSLQIKVEADSYDAYRAHSDWSSRHLKLFVINDLIPGSRVHTGYISQGINRTIVGGSDLLFEYLEFDGDIIGDVAAISLFQCNRVVIRNCKFKNIRAKRSVYIENSRDVILYNCSFENVEAGILIENSKESVRIFSNDFKNMTGTLFGPDFGQAVAGIGNEGPNFRVQDNAIENFPGESDAEDNITFWESYFDTGDQMIIRKNYIRGGGPSMSSGGILLGDGGGGAVIAEDNIVVNVGIYGMGIVGGSNMTLINNLIFQSQAGGVRNGIQAINYYGGTSTNITIANNKTNAEGYWDTNNMPVIDGWDTNEFFNDNITADILPAQLVGIKSGGGSSTSNSYIHYNGVKFYPETDTSKIYDIDSDKHLSEILKGTRFIMDVEGGYTLVSIKDEVKPLAGAGHGHLSTEIEDFVGRFPEGSVQLFETNIDSVDEPGFYHQNEPAFVTPENGYPEGVTSGCTLEVYLINRTNGSVKQILTPNAVGSVYVRFGSVDLGWEGWRTTAKAGTTPEFPIGLEDRDLNEVLDAGFYFQENDVYAIHDNNYPTDGTTGGILEVMIYNPYVGGVRQTWYPNSGDFIYVRNGNAESWGSWRLFNGEGTPLSDVNLNTITLPGNYYQPNDNFVRIANGYPIDGTSGGNLEVVYYNKDLGIVRQTFVASNTKKIYSRYGSLDSWDGWSLMVEDASAPEQATLLSDTNIDTIDRPGFYYQPNEAYVIPANGYPITGTAGGNLEVVYYNKDLGVVRQVYTPANKDEMYIRYGSVSSWGGWKMIIRDISAPEQSESLGQTDINTILRIGSYHQSEPAYITTTNGYPVNTPQGNANLEVVYVNKLAGHIKQIFTLNDEKAVYTRIYDGTSWLPWELFYNGIMTGKIFEGTALDLTNPFGAYQNNANTSTAYTVAPNPVVGGYCKVRINAASEPVVTGGVKVFGADFEVDTNMYLIASYNGVDVEYYFSKI